MCVYTHIHTLSYTGTRVERHLLADQITLKVAWGGQKPVAPPEPTGVEKIKVEMQAFLDKTAEATTVLAEKTVTGDVCLSLPYMCVYTYVCVYIYVHTYIHLSIHKHVCVCVCIYVIQKKKP